MAIIHFTEKEMIQEIAKQLKEARWIVEVEPLIGTFRPDLVALSPEGEAYIVEVKFGEGSLHFGTLAQLANFQQSVEHAGYAKHVQALLVTNLDTPERIANAAAAVDISIIKAVGSPTEVAETVCSQLTRGEIPNAGHP